MARTRLYLPEKIPGRAPSTPAGWRNLLDRAIARSQEVGDRRLQGLLKARDDGQAEAILRTHGIISEACLQREFPDLTPKS
jgi:hypothetical protein